MTLDLLTPTGTVVDFPILPDIEYSEEVIYTAAHVVLSQVPSIAINHSSVSTLVRELRPWVPVNKQGKIVKRIIDHAYKQMGASLDAKVMQDLGTYMASDLPSGHLKYDIIGELAGYKFGSFGDYNSCFQGKSTLMSSMQRAGCTALRFYNESGTGAGRAFVARSEAGNPIVFNSYGPTLEQFKKRIQLLIPDANLAFVRLTNHGAENGSLWINLGIGVWVGNEGEEAPDFVDLKVDTDGKPTAKCEDCDRELDARKVQRTAHGTYACHDCIEIFYEREAVEGSLVKRDACNRVLLVGNAKDYEFELTYEYVLKGQEVFLSRCADCQHLCGRNARLHGSIAAKAVTLCCMCATEEKYPWACNECGNYSKDEDEECCCGKTDKYKRR